MSGQLTIHDKLSVTGDTLTTGLTASQIKVFGTSSTYPVHVLNTLPQGFKIETTGPSATSYIASLMLAGTVGGYWYSFGQNFTSAIDYFKKASIAFISNPSAVGGMSFVTQANAPINFFTNGENSRMIVTGAGLVGIGQDIPLAKLHIDTQAVGNIGLIVDGETSQTADLAQFKTNGTIVDRVDENAYIHRGNTIEWSEVKTVGTSAGNYTELGTTPHNSKGGTIEFYISWYVGGNAQSRKFVFPYGYNAVAGWRKLAPSNEYSGYNVPVQLEVSPSSGTSTFRIRNIAGTSNASTFYVTYKIISGQLATAGTSLSDVWTASATTGTDATVVNPTYNNVVRQRYSELHISNTTVAKGYSKIAAEESATEETGAGAKGLRLYNDGEVRGDGTIGNEGLRIFNLTGVTIPDTTQYYNQFASITVASLATIIELWISVPTSAYAIAKKYSFPVSYAGTGGAWQKLIPFASTGPFGANDQDIEIQITTSTVNLRVIRKSGATANGLMNVSLAVGGGAYAATVVLANGTHTSGTFATVPYAPTAICQINGDVGIGGLEAENPQASIDINGTTRLGDSTTNYTAFGTDGTMTMAGTARVIKHHIITPGAMTLGGAPTPTLSNVSNHAVVNYSGTVDQDGHFNWHPPEDWDTTVQPTIKIYWMSAGANSTEVRWVVTYEGLADGEAIGAGATGTSGTTLYQNAPGAAETLEETAEFQFSGLGADDIVGITVGRDASDANNDVGRIIQIEIEYVSDKLGEDIS